MTSASNDVTPQDVRDAAARLVGGIVRTPCIHSLALSRLTGAEVWTKNEYEQRTGSFKERGARNALLQIPVADRARGVVAASAGNHALALAWHGRELGIPVTVVMPLTAPLVKQARCRELGARVLLEGQNIAEAKVRADAFVVSDRMIYVHGFNDAAIIAGAGTVALEVLEDLPDVDAIIVPIGGGGLIAGVALVAKDARKSIEIIGVEPARCASFLAAAGQQQPVRIQAGSTLADGLAVPEVGARAFAIARPLVDRVVTVDEQAISLAILRLVEHTRGVVEGAGAAPLAALLTNQLQHLAGKRVVLLLCGGNIDPLVLSRVIDHALAVDGRLVHFSALISDRPGGLADLTRAVADAGASVLDIRHERIFGGPDISRVQVQCVVEVRDTAHGEELNRMLLERSITVLEQVQSAKRAVGATA